MIACIRPAVGEQCPRPPDRGPRTSTVREGVRSYAGTGTTSGTSAVTVGGGESTPLGRERSDVRAVLGAGGAEDDLRVKPLLGAFVEQVHIVAAEVCTLKQDGRPIIVRDDP